MTAAEYLGEPIPTDTGDARSVIARALAGPHISRAFGKRAAHTAMGQPPPPDGTGPGTAAAALKAWRDADAALDALAAAGYRLVGPGDAR